MQDPCVDVQRSFEVLWQLAAGACINGCVACAAAGLRLTPGKGKGTAAAAAGASGGRRLFGDGSGSDSDREYSGDSDDDDDNYRPDLHHLSGRGKGMLSKRKRHGQLPGAAADKVRSKACRQD